VLSFDLFDEVVVASDDRSVLEAVTGLGIRTVLTSARPRSGTERVAEVVATGVLERTDLIVNVQGDEPFVTAEMLDGAIAGVEGGDAVGTVGGRASAEALADPNRVKVTVDSSGRARRFFRAAPEPMPDARVLQHVGVYAYRPATVREWVGLPVVPEEERESLEQARPLAHGWRIGVAHVAGEVHAGIDTEADLVRAEALMNRLVGGVGR
jgi:3-deoxy-manno-octulosonate cytidylyltransferase (CMP-KDO synthetase)